MSNVSKFFPSGVIGDDKLEPATDDTRVSVPRRILGFGFLLALHSLCALTLGSHKLFLQASLPQGVPIPLFCFFPGEGLWSGSWLTVEVS